MLCDGKDGRPLLYKWKENEETKQFEETDKYLYVADTVYNNIRQAVKNEIKNNGDLYIGIDGAEGAGKSWFATQLGAIITHLASNDRKIRRKLPFDETNFTWRADDFIRKNMELPNWSVIIMDESRSAAGKGGASSKNNKKLMNFVSEARESYHKFCIIILPRIQDLDKYLAEHRIKMLFHFFKKPYKRANGDYFYKLGKYMFYGPRSLQLIAVQMGKGKKNWYPYSRARPFKSDKCTSVNWTKVKKLKKDMTDKYVDDGVALTPKEMEQKVKGEIIKKLNDARKEWGLSLSEIWEKLGISNYEWYKGLEKDYDYHSNDKK